jgi:hypothetical protein
MFGFTDTAERVTPDTSVNGAVFVIPAEVALIVTFSFAVPAVVVTVNVAVEAPAATVMLTGTTTPAVSLDKFTDTPAAGAAPDSVTVPVEELPAVTLVGFKDIPVSPNTELSVSRAVRVPPFAAALIVAVAGVVTGVVVTRNVALLVPPLIHTVLSGTAAGLLLESVTSIPDAGARPFNVTVPVDAFPLTTLAGARLTPAGVSGAPGVTVRDAVSVTPL